MRIAVNSAGFVKGEGRAAKVISGSMAFVALDLDPRRKFCTLPRRS